MARQQLATVDIVPGDHFNVILWKCYDIRHKGSFENAYLNNFHFTGEWKVVPSGWNLNISG